MSAPRARLVAVVAVVAIGCGSPGGSAPPPASGPLPEGVVARVGARLIHAEAVGRVAAAQHLDVAAARDRAVRDALLAGGAEDRGLDRSLDVTVALRGVEARRLLQQILAEAARAPITDAEIEGAADRRARAGVPLALVSPELLERDVVDDRAGRIGTQLLVGMRNRIEHAPDEDALLALVGVDP